MWNEATWEVVSQIIYNALILFALSLLYATTNFDPASARRRRQVVAGFVIGAAAVFIISNPWELGVGLIFDTRSVLYGLSGLYFGGLATIIAAVIGIIYRISIGGAGVYAGVLTIVTTTAIGITWRHLRHRWLHLNHYFELYLLGLLLHIVTLLCFFAIPNRWEVIANVWSVYLLIFPFITLIVGLALHNQHERITLLNDIKQSRRLLQCAIDATHSMEVFALDRAFKYISFNDYHAQQMKLFYGITIRQGMNFLQLLNDSRMHDRFLERFLRTFAGETIDETIEIEPSPGRYHELQYTPIRDEEGYIIGVTVFASDVTLRYQHEQSILRLSYRDVLTGLSNRRYFEEQIARLSQSTAEELTVILTDVNGLKMMNDAFGHEAGDQLLKTVAQALQEGFGDVGAICRIGGDEFVCLLPNIGNKEAVLMIEGVKNALLRLSLNGMVTSLSYGVATKRDTETVNEVIRRAEDEMYRHKLFEVASHRSESIKTILTTLHEKNPREHFHSERVSSICRAIGEKLGMTFDDLRLLVAISNLHDIGKIAIDERILNKPGPLDAHEWEVIKTHPEIGFRIISTAPEYAEIAEDILCHHEHFDGTGYPRGLKGTTIPIRARIISVADAFDAMISDRTYRKKMSVQKAIEQIKANSGTQFDPQIVKVFLETLPQLLNPDEIVLEA